MTFGFVVAGPGRRIGAVDGSIRSLWTEFFFERFNPGVVRLDVRPSVKLRTLPE